MKMICDVPDEVIKLIKDGMWCGSHIATKIITNGIPLSGSEEPCEDAISRKEAISIASIATLSVNQVVTALEKLPSVNPQKPKSECEHDHEILKAHSDGANEVLAIIRAEIAKEAKCTMNDNRAGGLYKSLQIIDKYAEEGKA